MKVHYNLNSFSANKAVVTMGMFDGVHKGHLMLISKVIEHAKKNDGESVIITFWPHPRIVLDSNNSALRYINTIEEKIELLSKAGIDHVVVIPFTEELSQMTACDFTEKVLVNKINVNHLIAGFDHHFGRNREGSYKELTRCALDFNFTIEKVEPLLIDNEIISSTKTRSLINKGNIVTANHYLGYNFFIFGKVIKGNQIGRSIGFPTANIEVKDSHKLKPGIGVYAVQVFYDNYTFNGMLNIGFRPTINEKVKVKTIEVHIFDFDKDIYGKDVSIVFLKKIRDEKKFSGIEELKSQLRIDKKITSQYFKE